MRIIIKGLLIVSILFLIFVWSITMADAKDAKNVILMIGDGMGFNADKAGTYWRCGQDNGLIYHQFPRYLGCTTFSITANDYDPKKDKGYQPDVFWKDLTGAKTNFKKTTVTDSAAGSTTINSAKKTKNGRIGTSFDGGKLKMYSEYAAEQGRSIGTVTTVMFCHATPAGVMAHQTSRNLYREISREMILDLPMTVIMGGGHPEYSQGVKINKKPEELDYQYVGGKYIWDLLKQKNGFANATFIDEKGEFNALAEMTPDKNVSRPERVIGVFRSNSASPVDASSDAEGDKLLKKLVKQSELDNIPSLSTMSVGALNVLSRNKKGFFLMIEGGAIDGANHSNKIENMVLEHAGFTKAIDTVCQWVEKYSSWDETLLIITADHETGQLWGADTWTDKNNNKVYDKDDTFNAFNPIVNKGKSIVPNVQYATTGHSNSLVPFFAKGSNVDMIDKRVKGNDKQAAKYWNFSGDYIDNTDITRFMLHASGLIK